MSSYAVFLSATLQASSSIGMMLRRAVLPLSRVSSEWAPSFSARPFRSTDVAPIRSSLNIIPRRLIVSDAYHPLKRPPNRDTISKVHTSRLKSNGSIALLLASFIGGVYYYTMHSVAQDDFDDFDEEGEKKE